MEKTIEFEYEKETKNTFRFQEVVAEEGEKIIGSLYIQKSFFGGKQPEKVTVILKVEE